MYLLLRMRRHHRRKGRRKWCQTGVVNSNMTSDYKLEVVIWSKLRMRSDKIAKISEKQRRMAIILT